MRGCGRRLKRGLRRSRASINYVMLGFAQHDVFIATLLPMPFWQNVELLPSSTREKVRKRPKKTPKEYAKGRRKVKESVREAEQKREQNENAAEVMLYIELHEEELKEKMKDENLSDVVADFGSYDTHKKNQMMQAFGEARFDLSVDKAEDGNPRISMQMELPEGKVSEKLQLNQALQDALIARAVGKKPPTRGKAA